jgi:hypothetical protein
MAALLHVRFVFVFPILLRGTGVKASKQTTPYGGSNTLVGRQCFFGKFLSKPFLQSGSNHILLFDLAIK